MARKLAYKLYNGNLATMHVSNDLQTLIKIAKLHGEIFGKCYLVKDMNGNVVWEEEKK